MGTRLRGYVCPPVSGYYTFWIASDDQSQLLLSSDEQPGGRREIAYNIASTTPDEWGKNAYQRSEPQWLEAGKKYYIEALHKESVFSDHLSVGWQLPDGSLERPIPGKRLSPFIEALGRTAFFRAIELNGPAATIEGNSWEGTSATGQLPANFSFDGWTQNRATTAVLIPAVSEAAKAFMLRNTIAKHGAKDRLSMQVGGLPQGTYQVYLYIYEPATTSQEYSLLVEGLGPGGKPLGQEGKYRTGAQNTWVRIGPVRAQVLDGAATVEVVSTNFLYVGGVEVHRELQGVPLPTVVRAGADFTLPEYLSSYTLRGGADRILTRSTGYKAYELQDHLGNVRVVVGDGKQARVGADGSMQLNAAGNPFLRAAVRSFAHYYPFGMAEPGGTFQAQGSGNYRYGFNGKELDKQGLGGGGSTYDYGFRIYNPNIAKFLSVDPLADDFPWYTPYQFAGNMPIESIDLDGLEPKSTKEKEGFWEGAGKAVLEGSIKVVKYIYNNPSADGYGYHPGMKPASAARRAQYDINWSEQLDPYRQIEAFAENAVMGPINLYQGVVNKDGRQFVSGIPQVVSTIGVLAEVRALGITKKGPAVPFRKLCGCFTAGTTILTSNGSKYIEEVQVGDSVWIYSNEAEKLELKKVLDTFSSEQNEVFRIKAGETTIEATHDQLFFNQIRWLKAEDLSVGDTLVLYDGNIIIISSIERLTGNFKVHNLSVENPLSPVLLNFNDSFYKDVPNRTAPLLNTKEPLDIRR